jgi:hypothetical protein
MACEAEEALPKQKRVAEAGELLYSRRSRIEEVG